MSTNETVGDRLDVVRTELTATQIAAGLAFGTAIVFALMFVQEPLVHESMHNFRHAAGITCH
ncbi:CbtB family protein [Natronomonas moolapensis 8.8.11]|jgi:cobalt transporter subunit CbtB|uniref:CbtB family protein n=1 Tax=Natronomonas moolapensis (strain DSM 18674 / CECT 7526 / JCM 14361 / 8.8.11) TaxID=268739 RepID=M1XMZ5_NATM8|nr:CbtB domain-containing protein [Natronomonas moolapensis]CCQ35260.1 CbtB family protein [Natronomonas moolapensis 8.8.11]